MSRLTHVPSTSRTWRRSGGSVTSGLPEPWRSFTYRALRGGRCMERPATIPPAVSCERSPALLVEERGSCSLSEVSYPSSGSGPDRGQRRPAGRGSRVAAGGHTKGSQEAAGYSVGDKVVHAKFGQGLVLGVEGGGVVRVFFEATGEQKKLLVDY